MEGTQIDAPAPHSTNMKLIAPTARGKPFLLFPSKKKIRRGGDLVGASSSRRSVPAEFLEAHHSNYNNAEPPNDSSSTTPLVIPAIENHLKWQRNLTTKEHSTNHSSVSSVKDEPIDDDTSAAIRALQDEADGKTLDATTSKSLISSSSHRVIATHANTTFVGSGSGTAAADATAAPLSEGRQQYQTDVDALPTELNENDTAYVKTPIAEFGAALLRGMGWTEVTSSKPFTDEAFPRPHRLGLGAIPAAAATSATPLSDAPGHRRGRRPDQYQRDQKVQQQNEMYQREREKQLAADRQRTLQNGSIVWINRDAKVLNERRRRARIVRLVGVPGLNMVQVQYEKEQSTEECIKRHEIDRLVTRQELDETPFVEPPMKQRDPTIETGTPSTNGIKKLEKCEAHDRIQIPTTKRDQPYAQSSKTLKSQEKLQTWLVTNIRVRVVTKRLGRQYYKEKGIVVDVTRTGATLHMENGTRDVLEGVSDRYLETALPKVGGNVIVLAAAVSSSERGGRSFEKGRLLERTSRHGVVQLYDDMSVLTVPLDDLAEWCGPLDDDLGD